MIFKKIYQIIFNVEGIVQVLNYKRTGYGAEVFATYNDKKPLIKLNIRKIINIIRKIRKKVKKFIDMSIS